MLQVYVSNVLAVSNICCKCFILMLYMLQWPYTYVASICFKCFICFRRMLQVFYLDVPYVLMVIHIMVSIYSKCFICLDVCYKCIYLDVAVTIYICCKHMFINVSPVSDVCCISASCYNNSRRRKLMLAETVETCIAVPMCVAREAAWVVPTCMRINRHVAHNCMCTCTTCRRCVKGEHACSTVTCRAGPIPFLRKWGALISRGNRACIAKNVATPAAACSRERALLAHTRLREQGVQVGARRWGGHTGGGEA
jgi:hypothetical protein